MLHHSKMFGNTEGAGSRAVFAAEVLARSTSGTGLGYSARVSGVPQQQQADPAAHRWQRAAEGREGGEAALGGGRPGAAKGGWKGRKR